MCTDDEAVSYDEAASIGFKVIEMADRVKVADKVLPGATAKWCFAMDDVEYNVVVTVRHGA
ncbi:hypothetical protein FJ937_16565 [Mesorhizobium sp. B2-4-4]|uniref:hypothetical protein n=1 Tax=Mesorhizobium sp. B2-4-4 TaxID=2589945 RepID=UPI00112E03AC|nr:hypothetical protein [Mesorhizobium sp. B2-4-4]TPL49098.1 hypothetical protein FJ937_16565 [Mesorhizobium sp. B2-4-4]